MIRILCDASICLVITNRESTGLHLRVYISGLLLLAHVGKHLLLMVHHESRGRLCGGIKQHAEVASPPLWDHALYLFIHAHQGAIYPHLCVMLPHLHTLDVIGCSVTAAMP